MIAIVQCEKCGLRARYCLEDAGGRLEFDAAEFRSDCLTSADSRNFECPDLVGAIRDATVESEPVNKAA